MKIELTNVKYSEALSQETPAFTATIRIDGKVAGVAYNNGCGGCNMYSTDAKFDRRLDDVLEEHAKTLPPIKDKDFPDGLTQDADTVIGDLLNDHLMRADMKRKLASKILLVKDGKVLETKKLSKDRMKEMLANPTAVMKESQVLNLLPLDEAVSIVQALVAS